MVLDVRGLEVRVCGFAVRGFQGPWFRVRGVAVRGYEYGVSVFEVSGASWF